MNHIERCQIPVTWRAGDKVQVDREEGKVLYVYTNGYTLVSFGNRLIQGGVFNNDSTFGNEKIKEGWNE